MPSSAVASSAAFRVYVITGEPSASTLTWPLLSSRVTTHSVAVREKRAILSLKSAAATTIMPPLNRCPGLETSKAAGMRGRNFQESGRHTGPFLIDWRIRRHDGALVASSTRSSILRKIPPHEHHRVQMQAFSDVRVPKSTVE